MTINSDISKQLAKKRGRIYINDQFLLKECFYKGMYYNSYRGMDLKTKQPVVIKLCNQHDDHLAHEKKIFQLIGKSSFAPEIIYMDEQKINNINYYVTVMPQYGPSLKLMFYLMNKNFRLETICLIAINLLDTLQRLHKMNIVHRNLKPRKIITHSDIKNHNLFLIDFKQAKKYQHSNGKQFRYTENAKV